MGFPGGSGGKKESACNGGDQDLIPGEDSLEKGMATHINILAWENPHRKRSLAATVHGVAKTLTRTERLNIARFLYILPFLHRVQNT